MTKISKNLAVKISEYTDRDGNKKAKWLNIGSCLTTDDGGKFILLDRHINLAALPYKEGSTSIMVSMFDPKEKDSNNSNQENGKNAANYQTSNSSSFPDEELPF